jgi:protein-disulfide isomerase
MYDIIFKNKTVWKKAEDLNGWFIEQAKVLELDIPRFKRDLKSEAVKSYVDMDLKLTEKMGIRGTPGTLINGRFISGALPLTTFKKVIDEAIEKTAPLVEKGLNGDALYKEITKDGLDKIIKKGKTDKKNNPLKKYDIELSGNEPVLGQKDAPVTIVEFSEHQCPFCKRGAETIKNVVKNYDGKVKLVFKHMPLSFHKQALPAAYFTISVKKQYGDKKFFEASELLFANQKEWKNDHMKAFEKYSKELGLDWNKIKKTMEEPETRTVLNMDMSEAAKHQVKSVPAFFINGKLVSGAKKEAYFKAVIDNILKNDGGKKK